MVAKHSNLKQMLLNNVNGKINVKLNKLEKLLLNTTINDNVIAVVQHKIVVQNQNILSSCDIFKYTIV